MHSFYNKLNYLILNLHNCKNCSLESVIAKTKFLSIFDIETAIQTLIRINPALWKKFMQRETYSFYNLKNVEILKLNEACNPVNN